VAWRVARLANRRELARAALRASYARLSPLRQNTLLCIQESRRVPRHPSQSGDRRMLSRQRYVGAIPHLRGKTAFVRPHVGRPGQVMVQFEEPFLQEARGWWQFPESDFEA